MQKSPRATSSRALFFYLLLSTAVGGVQQIMRNVAWIWFVGCAAWIVDGAISLRYRNFPHAELAFAVAMVFLAAGLLYRQQRR